MSSCCDGQFPRLEYKQDLSGTSHTHLSSTLEDKVAYFKQIRGVQFIYCKHISPLPPCPMPPNLYLCTLGEVWSGLWRCWWKSLLYLVGCIRSLLKQSRQGSTGQNNTSNIFQSILHYQLYLHKKLTLGNLVKIYTF